MPDICKTDLLKTVSYLEDAIKLYTLVDDSSRTRNRVRLLKLHIKKLKIRINEKTGPDRPFDL